MFHPLILLQTPIFFKSWNAVLAASSLALAVHSAHRTAIIRFLKRCKDSRCPATVAGIKDFLQGLEQSDAMIAETTEALRWFYRQALRYRQEQESRPSDLPLRCTGGCQPSTIVRVWRRRMSGEASDGVSPLIAERAQFPGDRHFPIGAAAPYRWIAETLKMGHPGSVRGHVSRQIQRSAD